MPILKILGIYIIFMLSLVILPLVITWTGLLAFLGEFENPTAVLIGTVTVAGIYIFFDMTHINTIDCIETESHTRKQLGINMAVDIRSQSELASELIERKSKIIDGASKDVQIDRYQDFARGVLTMASIQGEEIKDLRLLIEKHIIELEKTNSPYQIS